MSKSIKFINSPSFTGDFSKDHSGCLHKKALVLAEGTWTDSKKRTHVFDSERIEKIADNTNALFQNGTRIPFLEDHVKSQDKTIGDLNSHLIVREITEDDLPEGRFQNLVGKLGLFADDIVVKASHAIKQAQEGLLSTISPGVDIINDCIREISATPTPAIPGMSLFKRYDSDAEFKALTWDDLESSDEDFEPIRESIRDLTDKLTQILENIAKANEEDLQGAPAEALVMQAVQDFGGRLLEILGVDPEETDEDPNMMNPAMAGQEQMMAQQQANAIMQQQIGQGYPYAGYSAPPYVAAFSMADMAEFFVGQQFLSSLGRKGLKFGKRAGLLTQETANQANRRATNAVTQARRLGKMQGVPAQMSPEQLTRLRKRRVGLTGMGAGALGVGALGTGYGLSRMGKQPEPPRRRGLFDLF